ncbi:MAG: hypothetical protein ACTHJM_09465 [Marmoricola sp.]
MTDDVRDEVRRRGREAALFGAIFVVASLLGALLWQAFVDLPRWQRVSGNVVMGPIEATKTIDIDAVYLFVSVPIALVLGAGLAYWRRRTPVTTVALIPLMSLLAAALMERFGFWFGPSNPGSVLKHAAIGATAPVQLKVQATGVLMAWPAAAVFGALLVLLFLPASKFEDDRADSDMLSALPTS